MANYLNIRNIKNKIIFFYSIFILCLGFNSHVLAVEYKKLVLKNGLEVYLLKNTNPIVTHIISYGVGSIEEQSSKEGLAHLLEHMMFLGSNKYSKELFSDKLKVIGATYNAYTSYDITLYHFNVPVVYLEEVMKIESDRMKWLKLNEETIENEKKVVNEERNMLYNKPYNVFFSLLYQNLFPTTNYGRSVIGLEANFNNVTALDLKEFYIKWYNPNNAKLFISGNIDFILTERLVKKHYEHLDNSNVKSIRASVNEVPYNYKSEITYQDSRINEDILVISFQAPSIVSDTSNNKLTSFSLILLSEILESKGGDMYKYFVLQSKLAKEINIQYDYSSKGHTVFNIIALPGEKVNIDVLKAELLKYLLNLSKKQFDAKLIDIYAKKIKDDAEYLMENNEEYVFVLAKLVNSGLSVEEYLNLQNNILNIKVSNFNKEVKKFFSGNYIISKAIK